MSVANVRRTAVGLALLGLVAFGGTAKADSIVSWGYDNYDQVSGTPAGSGFTAIAGGDHHSLALASDGSIVSWGDDWTGQVSNTPAGSGFTAIAGGANHSLALVPEPTSLSILCGLGLVGLAMAALKRRKKNT